MNTIDIDVIEEAKNYLTDKTCRQCICSLGVKGNQVGCLIKAVYVPLNFTCKDFIQSQLVKE